MHMAGGSGGVTMLRLPEGVVCLKPLVMNAAAEFFAGHLAESLGIKIAKMHVVTMAEDSFLSIKNAVRIAPAELEEHRDVARRTHSRSEFIALLEFVPGLSIQGQEVHDLLTGLDEARLLSFWFEVGALISFDAIINNVDRAPLLWDNDGNTANLMISNREGIGHELIGIDQAVVAIVDQGPGRRRYLQRLEKLVEVIFDDNAERSSRAAGQEWSVDIGLQRVKDAFKVSCGVDVCEDALFLGLRNGFTHIAEAWNDGSLSSFLVAAVSDARSAFVPASVDIGVGRLETMLDFVSVTASTIAQSRSKSAVS